MRRLFVINPNARGADETRVRELREFFVARAGTFDALITPNWEDARDRVRAALAADPDARPDAVIAVGGDGTVNAALNGFFDSAQLPISPGATLVVSDLGTGADYRRSLRAAGARGDWREAALTGEGARWVDLGLARFRAGASGVPLAPRFFANALTAGITAGIVDDKHRLPAWVPSSLGYLAPTVAALARRPTYAARIRADGGAAFTADTAGASRAGASPAAPIDPPLLALFVAKGAFLGGGLRLTGGAPALDDGRLRAVRVPALPLPALLRNFAELYRDGGLPERDGIVRRSVRELEVTGVPPLPLELDGEPLGRADFTVEVRPAAIRVAG